MLKAFKEHRFNFIPHLLTSKNASRRRSPGESHKKNGAFYRKTAHRIKDGLKKNAILQAALTDVAGDEREGKRSGRAFPARLHLHRELHAMSDPVLQAIFFASATLQKETRSFVCA